MKSKKTTKPLTGSTILYFEVHDKGSGGVDGAVGLGDVIRNR